MKENTLCNRKQTRYFSLLITNAYAYLKFRTFCLYEIENSIDFAQPNIMHNCIIVELTRFNVKECDIVDRVLANSIGGILKNQWPPIYEK